ncbi:hypothetical protein KM043_014053 [Ampulex compressa]|nr:hypothetical protein KM043_014053 [Ampulex compressa]
MSRKNVIKFLSIYGTIDKYEFDTDTVVVEFKNRESTNALLQKPVWIDQTQLNIRKIDYEIPGKTQREDPINFNSIQHIFQTKDVFEVQLEIFLNTIQLTESEIKTQYDLICPHLDEIFKSIFPRCRAYSFGSSQTGLGFKGSDLDIYMDIGQPLCDAKNVLPNIWTTQIFNSFKRTMYRMSGIFSNIVCIPRAKTPIIKFCYVLTGNLDPSSTECLTFKLFCVYTAESRRKQMNTVPKTEDQMEVGRIEQKQSYGTKKEPMLKSTNEDVQRAIEGLKDIPDEELQEFLDDEDFMEGLNVVDAWEGDEEKQREVDQKGYIKEWEQKQPSRDKHRRERKGSYGRERIKRDEKKREEIRRDPSKSTKDIERDKIRTKRDNESKLLAEKEKAIKHLLDSDNVVPPGTEVEAIQSIAERQNLERAQMRIRRSRERRRSLERHKGSPLRRRSPDRIRLSPTRRRSPLMISPERRRSPFKISAERHRSPLRPSPDKRRSPVRFNSSRRSPLLISPEPRRSPFRRLSWERRPSVDRRWSAERHRRRIDIHERRRSRSRDRQRSRSVERLRRRSRSPISRRYSPRRRSRTRSRSVDRRTRKRSPFINELARQLRNEAIIPPCVNTGYMQHTPIDGMSPLMNVPMYQPEPDPRPQMPPHAYMHQSGPSTPPPPPPPPTLPPGVSINSGAAPYMNFDMQNQPVNFDSMSLHTMPQAEYSSGPVLYNQPNTGSHQTTIRPSLLPMPVPSPQPVPAPGVIDHGQGKYNTMQRAPPIRRSPPRSYEPLNKSVTNMSIASSCSQSYKDHRSAPAYNGFHAPREERLKTPEPPVISASKQFEKTSLSCLLEASVSAKDSTGLPVLYPGFKPEILRHCEHALRELPIEDPRLKMKGRFFYDPVQEDTQNEPKEHVSNSILLQKDKNKIYWEEDKQYLAIVKPNMQMHQKICQTDEIETESRAVQATVAMVDFELQVSPYDLQQASKEEKKPIMDRLDWNMRETFDYTPKYREAGDLRWSLSNSSQKRPWNRTISPARRSDDHERRIDSTDHNSRNLKLGSPVRNRDSFSNHKGMPRDHYVRDRYSPGYRHSVEERDDFHESRSEHSRGESPMVLEDSGEELEVEHTFHRGSDWHGRGKPLRGKPPFMKNHLLRGKHSGRPYRGRGGYRGHRNLICTDAISDYVMCIKNFTPLFYEGNVNIKPFYLSPNITMVYVTISDEWRVVLAGVLKISKAERAIRAPRAGAADIPQSIRHGSSSMFARESDAVSPQLGRTNLVSGARTSHVIRDSLGGPTLHAGYGASRWHCARKPITEARGGEDSSADRVGDDDGDDGGGDRGDEDEDGGDDEDEAGGEGDDDDDDVDVDDEEEEKEKEEHDGDSGGGSGGARCEVEVNARRPRKSSSTSNVNDVYDDDDNNNNNNNNNISHHRYRYRSGDIGVGYESFGKRSIGYCAGYGHIGRRLRKRRRRCSARRRAISTRLSRVGASRRFSRGNG